MNSYNAPKARLRYRIRRSEGLCVRCGKPVEDVSAFKKCQICLEYCRKIRNHRDHVVKDNGCCIRCKQPRNTSRSAWHCQICLDKINKVNKQRKSQICNENKPLQIC